MPSTKGEATLATAGMAAITLAMVVVLVALYDAPVSDALLWLAVEAAYVVLPGWLLYRCLAGDTGGALRQLTIGSVLGLVLSILVFMATAATDTRVLMSWYPLIAGLPMAGYVFRRGQIRILPPAGPALSRAAVIWIGLAVLLAVTSYGLHFFSGAPLPGLGKTVTNSQDLTWAISLAADALHHWPMTDSSVSGEPLPYHNYGILHVALISQVSGIEIPLGFFRLWALPLVALVSLQFVDAGRSLFGNVWAGVVASFVFFFVGETHLVVEPNTFSLFGWLSPILMFTSPSYLFGLPFLLALVTLIGDRLASRDGRRPGAGELLMVALLGIGAAGAKVSILPLLLPGLGFYLAYRYLRERIVDWRAVIFGAVLAIVQLLFYWTLYRGHSSGLYLDLDAIKLMSEWPGLLAMKQDLDFLPGPLVDAVSAGLDFVVMSAAPLAGLYFVFRYPDRRNPRVVVWFMAILLTALLTLVLVSSRISGNQLYGVNYGLACGVILSAAGLVAGWRARPEGWERRGAVRALALAWVLLIGLFVAADLMLSTPDWVTAIVGPVLGLILFALVTVKVLGSSGTGGVSLLIVFALITTGFLGAQFNQRWPNVVDSPKPVLTDYRMTPGIYDGLRWLRDETPEDTIFAVNDQYAYSWNFWPVAYDYSAFSERRAFFAAWGYSQRVRDSGLHPPFDEESLFPERKRLNDAAFAGDPAAMEELRDRFGVEYMVVDKINGDPADLARMLRHSEAVFENPDLVIVRIDNLRP